MKPPTTYQRIVRAATEGRGVHLSWRDCLALRGDEAIRMRAELDDAAEARGCLDAWHEAVPPPGRLELAHKQCPSCGKDD